MYNVIKVENLASDNGFSQKSFALWTIGFLLSKSWVVLVCPKRTSKILEHGEQIKFLWTK